MQLAKPNFQYEKRQKELEKKRKNEEKLKRKLEKHNAPPASEQAEGQTDGNEEPGGAPADEADKPA